MEQHMLFLLILQMYDTHLFPTPFFIRIRMLQHCFMPIFEAINWIDQAIFHLIENLARVIWFISQGHIKDLDILYNNS
jgi:hypothetical protein